MTFDLEQCLTKFDRLPVFHRDFHNGSTDSRLDFIHHFHGFQNTDHCIILTALPTSTKGGESGCDR